MDEETIPSTQSTSGRLECGPRSTYRCPFLISESLEDNLPRAAENASDLASFLFKHPEARSLLVPIAEVLRDKGGGCLFDETLCPSPENDPDHEEEHAMSAEFLPKRLLVVLVDNKDTPYEDKCGKIVGWDWTFAARCSRVPKASCRWYSQNEFYVCKELRGLHARKSSSGPTLQPSEVSTLLKEGRFVFEKTDRDPLEVYMLVPSVDFVSIVLEKKYVRREEQ